MVIGCCLLPPTTTATHLHLFTARLLMMTCGMGMGCGVTYTHCTSSYIKIKGLVSGSHIKIKGLISGSHIKIMGLRLTTPNTVSCTTTKQDTAFECMHGTKGWAV